MNRNLQCSRYIKKILYILFGIIICIGCQLDQSPEVGSMAFTIDTSNIRYVTKNGETVGPDTIRIFILLNNSYLDLDRGSSAYWDDHTITDNLVSVKYPGLKPSRSGYKVLFAMGTKKNDLLQVTSYAEKSGIKVARGSATPVNLTPQDGLFEYNPTYVGKDIGDIVSLGDSMYVMADGDLYIPDGQGGTRNDPSVSNKLIGIQEGQYFSSGSGFETELWLITSDNGIVRYSDQRNPIGPTDLGPGNEILNAGTFILEDGTEGNSRSMIIFYISTQGFGFLYTDGTGETDPNNSFVNQWQDVKKLVDESGVDLQGLKLNEVLYDYSRLDIAYGGEVDNSVFFAVLNETFGILYITEADLADIMALDFSGQDPDYLSALNAFNRPTLPDKDEIAICVAASAVPEKNVYFGTTGGIYYAQFTLPKDSDNDGTYDADGSVGILKVLSGTESHMIIELVSSGTGIIAGLTIDDSIIIIDNRNKNNDVQIMPFYSGVPGIVNALHWEGEVLYVAGTKGMATIDKTQ